MNNYIYDQNSGELYHYGVLGMKWGIRKAARQATKDLRTQRNRDRRAGTKAVNRFNNTWIGKSRRKAAANNMWQALAKENKSDQEYKEAYKKAKEDAAKKLYPKQNTKVRNAVNKMSTGKALVQSFLMGSYGSLVYNQARSKGASKGKAVVQGITNNWANNVTFGSLSRHAQK